MLAYENTWPKSEFWHRKLLSQKVDFSIGNYLVKNVVQPRKLHGQKVDISIENNLSKMNFFLGNYLAENLFST